MKLEQFYNNIIDKVTFLLSYTHPEKNLNDELGGCHFFYFHVVLLLRNCYLSALVIMCQVIKCEV